MFNGLITWVGWNTFLAVIPVILAYAIAGIAYQANKRNHVLINGLLVILVLVWLVFLPNTCYLLTEWRHFLAKVEYQELYTHWYRNGDHDAVIQLMMHTLFYLCYSTLGMLTFALAIRPLARLARSKGLWPWLLAIPLFILVSTGVYLGLIERLNSWYIITQPEAVWQTLAAIPARPWLTSLIIAFAGFLWLAYLAMDIWIDGFLVRWKQVVH